MIKKQDVGRVLGEKVHNNWPEIPDLRPFSLEAKIASSGMTPKGKAGTPLDVINYDSAKTFPFGVINYDSAKASSLDVIPDEPRRSVSKEGTPLDVIPDEPRRSVSKEGTPLDVIPDEPD